jgi:signal transduction histidine kinase
VEKLPWAKPNPYLTRIGKEAEITDIKGRKFVAKNPAMVTKELSKYARDRELYWFHITSLKLLNPENKPDEFEEKALLEFENNNLKEFLSVQTVDRSKYLRYVSPLYVEEACLNCHAQQGYKVGDVRGAISITIPLNKTFAEISANKKRMLIAFVLTVLTLMAALFLMMKKLVLTPMNKLKSSIKKFSEDGFFAEKTLKTGDEFEDLSSTFSEMAGILTKYHSCLNDRIKAAVKDIEETNRKLVEANRFLNETNIRKSDFIARASHELRTPLTSIKGAMDYISAKLSFFMQQNPDETSLNDLYIFFDVIKKNSERLIRMVNDMLDIERIEMGTSELHFTNTNLSYLIAETIANFQINADEKGISIQPYIPDSLNIYADEDRIRQVIINLLSNAAKFSSVGSEVIIMAYPERGFVITEIWDDGPGVSMSEQKKVFEKFYKNGNKEGTGLGLAICKSIIEAHNGIIGVKSDGKNGSCFYFKLPHICCKTDTMPDSYTEQIRQKQKLLEIAKGIGTPY